MLPFLIAMQPTPIFNRVDLSNVFTLPLPFDTQHLVRALEMVAFPGTIFDIVCEYPNHVLEVRTADYPTSHPLFIDGRFGQQRGTRPEAREKILPHFSGIKKKLESQLHRPYIWGGNASSGISQLLAYYPPPQKLTPLELNIWTLSGVDCSGMIYEATNGCLPRNTKDLLFIGRGVAIEHLSWEEIQKKLEPLDLIVWKGHVCVVFDERHIIESNHAWGGVRLTTIPKRFELFREIERRIPSDDPVYALHNARAFLIRRFFI